MVLQAMKNIRSIAKLNGARGPRKAKTWYEVIEAKLSTVGCGWMKSYLRCTYSKLCIFFYACIHMCDYMHVCPCEYVLLFLFACSRVGSLTGEVDENTLWKQHFGSLLILMPLWLCMAATYACLFLSLGSRGRCPSF